MTCPSELTRTLYLDDELPRAETERYVRHLEDCAECSEELRVLETIEEWIAEDTEMPAGLPDRVLGARGRPAYRFAAIALAAVALLVLYSSFRPERSTRTGGPDLETRIELALARADAEWLDGLDGTPLVPLHRIAVGREPELARAALDRLGGFAKRESLPVLLDALELPDRRGEAMDALAALGDPRAVDPIAEYLADGDWNARALAAVSKIGGPEAARVIATALDEAAEGDTRIPLAAALARLDDETATRKLLDRSDRMPEVLAELTANVELHLGRLLATAEGRDPDAARLAIRLLGELRRPDAVDSLGRRLGDGDLRGAAASALARIGTVEAGRALLDSQRCDEIDEAFAGGGPGLQAACLERLESDRPGETARVVALLAHCGGPTAVSPLLDRLGDRSLAPRVIETLGLIDCEEARTALSRIARIRRHRRGAVAALGRAEAVDALLALALADPDSRAPVLAALSGISTAEAVEAVLRIDGRHHEAVRALKRMEREIVVDSLTAMLDGELASGARGALVAIGAAPPGHRRIGLD